MSENLLMEMIRLFEKVQEMRELQTTNARLVARGTWLTEQRLMEEEVDRLVRDCRATVTRISGDDGPLAQRIREAFRPLRAG